MTLEELMGVNARAIREAEVDGARRSGLFAGLLERLATQPPAAAQPAPAEDHPHRPAPLTGSSRRAA